LKPLKLLYGILAVGIFLLTFNIILGASILSKFSEINGSYKTNKVSVNLLSSSNTQGNASFSKEDMEHLQGFSFKSWGIAYTSEGKSTVSYKDSKSEAEISGVSDKYSMFHQIKLKAGSFITSENEKEMVAVLDEPLAEALFNNTNVVNMHVELFHQQFKIIGIIASEESILQTLADSGRGHIYIPVDQMLEYSSNSKITSFEVTTSHAGTTGQNISNVKEALASIGKNPSNYKITDFTVENVLVEQKILLSIFIYGIGTILLLLLYIYKKAISIYGIFKLALKENYFKDAVKQKCVEISLVFLEILWSIALIYLIWKTVKFNLYIPPNFVPEELIDTTFYSDLFKSLIQEKVQNVGYIPTFWEMKLNLLCVIQNWNLCLGLLIGFPLYFLGLKLLSLEKKNTLNHLVYCCIFFIFSVLLDLLILLLLKLSIQINIKGLSLLFIFLFLWAVRSFTSAEK
jgi:hypothetical protein